MLIVRFVLRCASFVIVKDPNVDAVSRLSSSLFKEKWY